jgi:chromosome segregation ATPase
LVEIVLTPVVFNAVPQPTPLYVMDEIDAALDFKNVSIVANYIKDRTKNAQFVIISLRYACEALYACAGVCFVVLMTVTLRALMRS